MRCVRSCLLSCAAVLAVSATARAADLGPPLPPLPHFVEAPVAEFSGWYVRADAAYRFNRFGSVSTLFPPVPTSSRLDRSGGAGVGVGYRMGWFRGDLTVDYGLLTRYNGDTAAQADDYKLSVESFTGLFNGYADLGTWHGVTPYVGAGVGTSFLRTSKFTTASLVPASVSAPSYGTWTFSWAAMAGVNVALGRRTSLDIGYRHLDLGSAKTASDVFGNALTVHNLSAEEVRVGLRVEM